MWAVSLENWLNSIFTASNVPQEVFSESYAVWRVNPYKVSFKSFVFVSLRGWWMEQALPRITWTELRLENVNIPEEGVAGIIRKLSNSWGNMGSRKPREIHPAEWIHSHFSCTWVMLHAHKAGLIRVKRTRPRREGVHTAAWWVMGGGREGVFLTNHLLCLMGIFIIPKTLVHVPK